MTTATSLLRRRGITALENIYVPGTLSIDNMPADTMVEADFRLILEEFVVFGFHRFLEAVDVIVREESVPGIAAGVLLAAFEHHEHGVEAVVELTFGAAEVFARLAEGWVAEAVGHLIVVGLR